MFYRTIACLKKAQIKIPQLSPTHTRAKIVRWCIDPTSSAGESSIECYDPLFVLKCSPDLVSEGYRKFQDHEPFMIVEAHDEGVVTVRKGIELDTWYDVGTTIGDIDDGEDGGDDDVSDWVWQAYSHDEEDDERETTE